MKNEIYTSNFQLDTTPRILYWKWDEGIFEENVLENKISDILKRSNFDLVYVSFHWIKVPFVDERITHCIRKCCDILHSAGKLFMLDIDVRNEAKSFFEEYPDKAAGFIWYEDVVLDQNGHGKIVIKPQKVVRWWNIQEKTPRTLIKSVAFDVSDGNMEFVSDSIIDISEYINISYDEKSKYFETEVFTDLGLNQDDVVYSDEVMVVDINAGIENAGKTAVVIPYVDHVCPDFFSEEIYLYYQKMFDAVSDIPLDGIGVDEWGYSLPIAGWKKEGGIYIHAIPYTHGMRDKYHKLYNEDLDESLIHMYYMDKVNKNKSVKAINQYIETFRIGNVHNEEWIYDTAKRMFGEKAFVGAHPTWNGEKHIFGMEALYNGLDWWEVKRDYAQTDEFVIIPIRAAMARKAGGPVWFNMFYQTARTELDQHVPQSWRNIKYGGRQHQLGYECPREGILEFCNEGVLEQVSEIEGRIKRLNDIQVSQPDSRVLCVFGYENATSWIDSERVKKEWVSWNENLVLSTSIAEQIFELGYFCDLIPSYEIDNGSVKIIDGNVCYGPMNHTYDAVVLVNANYCKISTIDFLNNYALNGGNLIICSDIATLSDGSSAREEFEMLERNSIVKYKIDYSLDNLDMFECEEKLGEVAKAYAMMIIKEFEKLNIEKNKFDDGCILTDGMAVFSLENAKLPVGNSLEIAEYIDGHLVEFVGEDYFAIKLKVDGSIDKIAYGDIVSLYIDNNKII